MIKLFGYNLETWAMLHGYTNCVCRINSTDIIRHFMEYCLLK